MLHYLQPLLEGLPATLTVTLGAFAIGLLMAIPLTIARRSHWRLIRMVIHLYVDLVRAVPPLVWVFLVFFGMGSNIKLTAMAAGLVSFGAIAAAYISEIYRSGVIAVDAGQWEAAHALGMSERVTWARIVGPQAVQVAIPVLATYLVGLLKDTAVVSIIGVHEITFRATSLSQTKALDGLSIFLAAAVIYLAMSVPLAIATRWLDKKVTTKLASG
jgi:polar amino acid transport system permease protein